MRSVSFALIAAILACVAGPAGAGENKAEHKVTQSVSYLTLDPIYASIVTGERPTGMLMVGIGIDIPDAGLRENALNAMPVLRDAYVRNLMAFAATSVRPWRQPDVNVIAARLQGVTDRGLGRKGARILLAQVAIKLNP